MLTPYQQNILIAELKKADYNGMTSSQGFAWLTQPVQPPAVSQPSGATLTPVVVAGLLGPTKAEALAAAIKQKFPTIADHLMEVGVSPNDTGTQAVLTSLVSSGVLAQADATALLALGTTTTTPPIQPPRLTDRFGHVNWPHVDANGNPSTNPNDPPISGFPNSIAQADFNAAWTAAGRT